MKPIVVLAALALWLSGCASGGTPPQTADAKPRPPSIIEEMGSAGGGGY